MSAVKNMSVSPQESSEGSSTRTKILYGFTVAAIISFFVGLYFSLGYAGTDATQGEVQRIFYTHVAAFSGASIAFGAAVVGGIQYLRTREAKWDTLALAGVEVGFILSLINLITGAIWARPIWNTWWTWDPRLTSAAIMVLTYAAYLMLRNGIENEERRRRFASIYGILAITTVIFTFVIIRIRPDTIHPTVIGNESDSAEGSFAMAANMVSALGINSFIWCCIIVPAMMWWRIRLENAAELVNHAKIEYLSK